MLSFLLWMVTDFDNTSSEVQREQHPENWSKLSFIVRFFLPVAGLLLLFRQKHFFSRLLLQLDRNCVSVFCPSFSRREKLLKWAGSRLPETWSSPSRTLAGGVAELWSDGSLLCTLINSAIPGACPNPHRHWKKPPLHAQAVAYKYLGVIPIFTDNDLRGELTICLERNFIHYLNELQQAIVKLSDRNDTPKSVSMFYIARGMGLYSGEQHRKTVFYIYPNKDSTGRNSNIIVHIRGPYATYGKAIIPKFHNDLFTTPEICVTSDLQSTKKLLNGNSMKPRNSFMKNFSLPFMQYHKKHMGDNIVIDVTMEDDRAKVTYIPKNYGMYEIIMISNGELIRGCPFNVHILNNISSIEDSFESEERVDDIPSLRRRKILSKTIDFIDEQMPMADVLKKYRTKGKIEPHIKYKEPTHIESTITEEDIDEGKDTLDGIVIPPKELAKNNSKINENNEDEYLLSNKIYSSIGKSELNLQNDIIEPSYEKRNSDYTDEHRMIELHVSNEYNQTRGIIRTVNNSTDNKSVHKVVNNDLLIYERLQLKSTTESYVKDTNLEDTLDSKNQIYEVACNTNNTIIPCVIARKAQVNKLKVPEKFCDNNKTNNTFSNGLDTKYFKNAINTSNRREMPNSNGTTDNVNRAKKIIQYLQNADYSSNNNKIAYDSKNDDNNNNNIASFNAIEICENNDMNASQKISKTDIGKGKVIPRRFVDYHQHFETKNTSPICPDHIDPEVENEYMKMSVAERRKIFSRKFLDNNPSSMNSSLSENENGEDTSVRGRFRKFEGLSVMNYLGSLKTSQGTKDREVYPLCSAMSLPNISAIESETFRNSVRERRNFWEKISTSSSSLSINSEASLKKHTRRLAETERCKLIWKKPDETTASNTSMSTMQEMADFERSTEISKSVDDILSISNIIPHQNTPKKYKSMDHSLDKCTVMSIAERKKMLLKQNYEKEIPRRMPSNSLRDKSNHGHRNKIMSKNLEETKIEDQKHESVVFCSIWDRIKKYDSACNLSINKIEEEVVPKSSPKNEVTNDVTTTTSKGNNHDGPPQQEMRAVKSHFKRAIKYFKNLEEKSLNKPKINPPLKDCRRHSLDIQPNKCRSHRKGGSLNLPNVSQRFSVNNLYKDVFGERRGSFKGAANRSALVEALATFSRKENHSYNDEDSIMYDMFQRKAKIRRRRSIKSIFDIYY